MATSRTPTVSPGPSVTDGERHHGTSPSSSCDPVMLAMATEQRILFEKLQQALRHAEKLRRENEELRAQLAQAQTATKPTVADAAVQWVEPETLRTTTAPALTVRTVTAQRTSPQPEPPASTVRTVTPQRTSPQPEPPTAHTGTSDPVAPQTGRRSAEVRDGTTRLVLRDVGDVVLVTPRVPADGAATARSGMPEPTPRTSMRFRMTATGQ